MLLSTILIYNTKFTYILIGTYLAAAEGQAYSSTLAYIYVSSDSGNTWLQTNAPNGAWHAITSSSYISGLVLIAAINGGGVYTASLPTYAPTLNPTQAPTFILSQSPSTKETSSLISSPFDSYTWSPDESGKRIKYYMFVYAAYFMLLFLLLWFFEYIGALRETRDLLHSSAINSNLFIDFYSKLGTTNKSTTPKLIYRLLSIQKNRESETVLSSLAIEKVVDKCDKFIDFHYYILDKHTCFGCQPTVLKEHGTFFPKGFFEDFLIYSFNNHEVLRCFCSFDYFPLTYTAKRLMFIGRHTILFLIGIFISDTAIFSFNVSASRLYVINFFLSHPLKLLSEQIFQYVYYSIFIYLGTCLETNMGKQSTNIKSGIYYFLCFLFMMVIIVILIVVCVLTTPTDQQNQPIHSSTAVLLRLILELQLSVIIIDFTLSMLLFIPSFYFSAGLSYKLKVLKLLIIGQRFIESEYISSFDSPRCYYCCKELGIFYYEFAVTKSFAIKKGWITDSKDIERETELESIPATRIEMTVSSPFTSRVGGVTELQ